MKGNGYGNGTNVNFDLQPGVDAVFNLDNSYKSAGSTFNSARNAYMLFYQFRSTTTGTYYINPMSS